MKLRDDGIFELTREACRALIAFSSEDECRAHLNCVHFEPATGRAFATDGHSLIIAKNCGRVEARAFSVSRADFHAGARLVRRKTQRLLVSFADGEVTLQMADVLGEDGPAVPSGACVRASEVKDRDGTPAKFPPVDAVVPAYHDDRPTGVVGMSGRLLARLDLVAKAAQAIGCGMRWGAELDPVVATATSPYSNADWTAVLMPMRI